MTTLNLRSAELEALADALLAIAATLDNQSSNRTTAWNTLPTFTDASSLLLSITQLHRHNAVLTDTVHRISSAARVLSSTATAVRVLESYLATVERATDHSPMATAVLHQIAGLGDLLDFMCAREIAALCTQIATPPLRDLKDFGDLPATAIHEFNLMNAPPHIQDFVADNPDITLLEVGDGTLVAAVGDVDSADTVATLVTGVGSSDPAQWPGNLNRARTIHQSTGAATVMWLGYTAPASLPLAVSDRSATAGAVDLRMFQETLAHRQPGQRQVVVGYSYGSVVVGSGASESTATNTPGFDAVVLVGSPGAGVGHARDIAGEVYAVTGSRDPIGLAATDSGGIHGADPTSGRFGATVWESTARHSDYWEDPVFLGHLAEVMKR